MSLETGSDIFIQAAFLDRRFSDSPSQDTKGTSACAKHNGFQRQKKEEDLVCLWVSDNRNTFRVVGQEL